jgi:hypothetical protein
MKPLTAIRFLDELEKHRSDAEYKKIRRYFKDNGTDNKVLGVRMKTTFDLSKESVGMPLNEIGKLLDSPYYEARMGAVSIMDFQVRPKSASEEYREARFELYLNRHDRINNWDFVDRAAPRVIGSFLYDYDLPRDLLYDLARADNPWERRTAIVSTAWFIKKGDLEDTFNIAEQLLNDDHEFVQKAVGTWLRHAGKLKPQRLLQFLEKHAPAMPRTVLSVAIEKLDSDQKAYFRKLKG